MSRAEESPRGYDRGRLTARPRPAARVTLVAAGEHIAAPALGWQGALFVPSSVAAAPETPAPLMLTLHGATGSGVRMLGRWQEDAERAGLVLLAPDSEAQTWDALIEGFGADVARIDRALEETFTRLRIDPARCFIGGFSDGASYALSLGIANGDLFRGIVANSPGFCWPPSRVGSPRILITHGTEDTVLPVELTGQLIAAQVEQAGYHTTYHEFAGGHVLTPEIHELSLAWMGLR